ncbi:MAG: ferrous iron transport protein A [Firmicutes bacterium]|nr:ferrous iron transport protein A [Bacillota bacterium]
MTLDKVRRGQKIRIISLPDELTRAKLIRFGIAEGTVVICQEVVPAGPVVISRNRQEIAIGRNLARLIGVEPLVEGSKNSA